MIGFSPACERNKEPILVQLRAHLESASRVLEIGSGTGQHAVHFARGLPHLRWQPSERAAELAGLAERIASEGPANLLPPVVLDVGEAVWPAGPFDAAFTANTLHIMGWPEVVRCFAMVGTALRPSDHWLTYGPFMRQGRHTSPSNERFDSDLRAANPGRGLRDVEALTELGMATGFVLEADVELPANNALLVWSRCGE